MTTAIVTVQNNNDPRPIDRAIVLPLQSTPTEAADPLLRGSRARLQLDLGKIVPEAGIFPH